MIPEIERLQSEELLALVRILDSTLNNTSLILLFEIGGQKLLFPGDAQLENWSYALRIYGKLLKGVTVYKVGHHGSLNATPKTLWKLFEHRAPAGTPDRLTTMLSTLSGKHGSVDRGTEVPRKPLLDELEGSSVLFNTQDVRLRDLAAEVVLPL